MPIPLLLAEDTGDVLLSGSALFPGLNTPRRIIETAMRHAGKLSEGGIPSSEQYINYFGDLNRLVNLWQTQGLKLWLQKDLSVTLVAAYNGPYSISSGGTIDISKPLRIQQGYYLDVNNVRRPISPLSWDEWLRLSTTVQQGAVTQYFVDKQVSSLNVYFWLTPDAVAATGTAHLLTQYQVTNAVSLVETMDFPAEWGIALVWGLADEICTGQPQAIMDRCQGRASVYRAMLEDWDVEDTPTSFAPDTMRGYRTGSFN